MMRMVNLLKIYSQVYKSYKTMLKNVFRLFDVMIWPYIQFFSFILFIGYFSNGQPEALGIVVLGLMGWRLMHHMHLEVVSNFMDEYWSRCLAHLMISPLTKLEYIIGSAIGGLAKGIFVIIVFYILAHYLYGFEIENMANVLLGLAIISLFGIATGIICLGVSYIYNEDVFSSALVVPDILVLLAGVYYPVSIFPGVLKDIAYLLPATYGFEMLRNEPVSLAVAAALLAAWLGASWLILIWCYDYARKTGKLTKFG